MAESSFAGKFIQKIKKIDTEQVESFLAQVLREKAFLEVILDSITEGVIVTEEKLNVVFINEAARQLLGLMRTETMNQPLAELLKTDGMNDLIEEFRETQEPIRRREIITETQPPHVYAVTIVPIENEDSVATHSVWIISDRTDAVRRQKEKAQIENLESLSVLTAGVAHEVKNPLNSLNIHAQLVQRGAGDLRREFGESPVLARLEKSTGVILEEIERLKYVVDDFIHAVRPVKPEFEKKRPNDIILGLAELIGPDCAKKEINLTLNLDPEVPPILIDPAQMRQALLNILKNSMESMEEDRERRLQVRTRLKSDHVLIEVEDTGCGIAEEERMRIFEPYHSTKFSGTGLGLVLVYRIVKAHRGAIALKSEVGIGTMFSIALPLDERPMRMLSAQVEPAENHLENAGENDEN